MILVLCHGNVYRSVVCEAILKLYSLEVCSAGFRVGGRRAAKKVRDFLAAISIDVENHRSKQVTTELLDQAELIIYMDNGNLRRLKELGEHYEDKSVCLAIYLDKTKIPDPAFISDKTVFKQIMLDIITASHALAKDARWKLEYESRSDLAFR